MKSPVGQKAIGGVKKEDVTCDELQLPIEGRYELVIYFHATSTNHAAASQLTELPESTPSVHSANAARLVYKRESAAVCTPCMTD